MINKINILDLTVDELQNELALMSEKAFRAKQIFKWLHRGVLDFAMMSDLSASLRQKLDERFETGKLVILRKLNSKADDTQKYLFRLSDGNTIESVLMKYNHGCTVCISTQVGCKMGCKFCASSFDGFVRDLTAGEILAQVLVINNDLKTNLVERAIDNIVLMGSGEPLDNFDNTVKFLRLINHKDGLNFGFRHITISTSGIVPKMLELAQLRMPITLSVSLHAPNDLARIQLMPIVKKFTFEEVMRASHEYFSVTGRRVTFEYALIKDINDSEKDAFELANRLSGMACHVNLIPINEVASSIYRRSSDKAIHSFKQILERKGISVTRRRELGTDIEGACGQLRRGYNEQQEKM